MGASIIEAMLHKGLRLGEGRVYRKYIYLFLALQGRIIARHCQLLSPVPKNRDKIWRKGSVICWRNS